MRWRMTSSPDAARAVAERVRNAAHVARGDRRRRQPGVYRAVAGGATYALKSYPPQGSDVRDRLGHEFGALTFMAGRVEGWVPRPIAADRERGFALYEWIDGARIAQHGPADVRTAVASPPHCTVCGTTPPRRHCRRRPRPFSEMPTCRPAGRSFLEIARRERPEAMLERFLADRVEPALERLRRPDGAFAELPAARRTLSPSDFGFHNALRRPDGRIAFIDFEYFGWDDPVKLVAGLCWHPGMALSAAERELFTSEISAVYAADGAFAARLAAYLPLIGLRWIAIVLNEFLPEVWERRVFAGRPADREAAKRQQLDKAEALFERLGEKSGA